MTADAIKRDNNIKGCFYVPSIHSCHKEPRLTSGYTKGLRNHKNRAFYFFFRSLQSSLIFGNITTHTTNTSVLAATLDVRNNQPDGMAVAEIQSGYDLPEELPGLFGS